jgi:hypothetical protein
VGVTGVSVGGPGVAVGVSEAAAWKIPEAGQPTPTSMLLSVKQNSPATSSLDRGRMSLGADTGRCWLNYEEESHGTPVL